MKKGVCYHKTDCKEEEKDYSIIFIPSGFKGVWIKVWEYYDYTVGVDYASEEENEGLNKEVEAANDWRPTPENINVLPEPIRIYIHELETNSDPADMVAENTLLRDQLKQMQKKIKELTPPYFGRFTKKDLRLLKEG